MWQVVLPNAVYRPRHRARCSDRIRPAKYAFTVSLSLQMKTPIESHGKDQVWWTSNWVHACLRLFEYIWLYLNIFDYVWVWNCASMSKNEPYSASRWISACNGRHASGICSSSKVASLGSGTCMSQILCSTFAFSFHLQLWQFSPYGLWPKTASGDAWVSIADLPPPVNPI